MQIAHLKFAILILDDALLRIRKFVSWSKPRPSDDHLLDELERLALLSPHLLGDLGFTRDGLASAPDTQVWRRGRFRVLVATSTISAFASTD